MEQQFAYIIKYADSRGDENEIIVKLPTDLKQVIIGGKNVNQEEFISNWLKDVSVDMLKNAGLTVASLVVAHSDVRPN